MRNFILRRLLQTLPMLLLASFIIFLLFAKTPGDFIDGNMPGIGRALYIGDILYHRSRLVHFFNLTMCFKFSVLAFVLLFIRKKCKQLIIKLLFFSMNNIISDIT